MAEQASVVAVDQSVLVPGAIRRLQTHCNDSPDIVGATPDGHRLPSYTANRPPRTDGKNSCWAW